MAKNIQVEIYFDQCYILCHTFLAAPGQPAQPVVDKCGRNFVDLSWQAPASDGGKPIIGYDIEASQNASGHWVSPERALLFEFCINLPLKLIVYKCISCTCTHVHTCIYCINIGLHILYTCYTHIIHILYTYCRPTNIIHIFYLCNKY